MTTTATTRRAPKVAPWIFTKTGHLESGSISSATLRPGDILENFYHHFACPGYRAPAVLGKLWAESLLSYRQWKRGTFSAEVWNEREDADGEVEEMLDTLQKWLDGNELLLPFHYIGSHPGDGADIGIWFAHEDFEFNRADMPIFSEYPDKVPADGWAIVNERGNIDFYQGKTLLFSYC